MSTELTGIQPLAKSLVSSLYSAQISSNSNTIDIIFQFPNDAYSIYSSHIVSLTVQYTN